MKILVFNVKYSENLGDGVLAQCLERELEHARRDIAVETMDIAGRHAFGASRGHRKPLLVLLALLPGPVRRIAVEAVLGRALRRLSPDWRARMAAADAVVIGGGNLFQDDDLNFPLKIAAVLDAAHQAALPLAIHAVGVSRHWSRRAAALFGRLALNQLVQVSVRDEGAKQSWISHFGRRGEVETCPDPGLLARDLLPPRELAHRSKNGSPIGICVTHPVVLRRHAGMRNADIPFTSARHYRELAQILVASGYSVELFSNGATEDQKFLDAILRDPGCAALVAEGSLRCAPRPRIPEDLVRIVNAQAAIVAHRLHANIVAYSLKTPHVGLGWDMKVEAFFASVGRDRYFTKGTAATPEHVAQLLLAAIDEGIDPDTHAACLRQTRAAVALLAERLLRASGKLDATAETAGRLPA